MSGKISRQRDLYRASDEGGLERGERASDELLERLPILSQIDAAGFEARHFEQVVDEPRGASRLVANRERLGFAAELIAASELQGQCLRQSDERGERRAQIMRQRRQHRIAQPLRFHVD